MKKVFYGFDLLKFMMAMLIVATHAQLFVEYEAIYYIAKIVYEIAVPTFFTISTFLYSQKLLKSDSDKDAWTLCWKDTKRLLWLCLFWFIVDFPMTYDTFFRIANWKEIVACFAINDPVRGLWFIKALIINKIILCIFRNHLKALSIVSLLIFVVFSLGYTPILCNFSGSFHPYFNFYFHTIFCCIGALFAKYEFVKRFRLDVLGLCLSLVFIWRLFNYDYAVIAYRLVCPLFFMIMFMNMKEPCELQKPIYIFMRQTSILIYFIHFNILWLMHHYSIWQDNSFMRFLSALLGAILFSVLVLRFEKANILRWLKYSH